MDDSIVKLVVVLIVLIVVFLLAREFWCWYWKINEIRDLLQQIAQSLNANKDISSDNNQSSVPASNDGVLKTNADSLSPIHEGMAKRSTSELLEITTGTKSNDYTKDAKTAAQDILNARNKK